MYIVIIDCDVNFNYRGRIYKSDYICLQIKYYAGKLESSFNFNEPEKNNCSKKKKKECNCCLCKLCPQIKPHKTITTHLCDRAQLNKSSQSPHSNGDACNSCVTRLIACSKTNADTKTVECCFKECNKSLRRGYLKRHYISHLKVKKLVCPMCHKTWKSKSSLNKHQRMHLSEWMSSFLQSSYR